MFALKDSLNGISTITASTGWPGVSEYWSGRWTLYFDPTVPTGKPFFNYDTAVAVTTDTYGRPTIFKDRDGNLRSTYKVKVRSQQYSFFGKNQKDEEVINKIDKEIKDLVSDKKEPVAEDVPFWYGVFDDLNENFTFVNYDCIKSF